MPVPSTIDDLSTTAGSNSPAGSETPKDGDNYLRSLSSFIAILRDKLNGTSNTGTVKNGTFSGTMAGAASWSGLQTFLGGIAASNVLSGTYTPTLTNVLNVSGSTAYACQYMRVDSVVTVSGRFNIDATSTGSATELGISLPIASDFATVQQLGGSAVAGSTTANNLPPIEIRADVTNNRAQAIYQTTTDVNNNSYAFNFTYLIV